MIIIEQMPLHLLDFCSNSYKDPELWHYGILTFVINWFPGVIASVHLLSYQRNELGFIKTFFWCGKWSLFVAIAISTIVMYISTYYVDVGEVLKTVICLFLVIFVWKKPNKNNR